MRRAGQSALKAKPSKPLRTCVFCGSSRHITKQHILPNQLRRFLPRNFDSHGKVLTNINLATPGVAVMAPDISEHQGHLGTRKIRRVCQTCNSGWLRSAEEAGLDVLRPLILGEAPVFTAHDQRVAALVSSTIFTMIDLDDIPTSAVSESERHFIYEHRKPPANWHLFAGRINDPNWQFRYRHHGLTVSRVAAIRPPRPNTQISTVTLGNLLLHVVSNFTGALNIDVIEYARTLGVRELNGIADFQWRLLPVLRGKDVDTVCDRLFRTLLSAALQT